MKYYNYSVQHFFLSPHKKAAYVTDARTDSLNSVCVFVCVCVCLFVCVCVPTYFSNIIVKSTVCAT